jgi:hypothetical protein
MRTHDNVRAESKGRGREGLREEGFRRRRGQDGDGAGEGHRRHRSHHRGPHRAEERGTTGRDRGRRGGPGRWDRAERGGELSGPPSESAAGRGEPELRNAVRALHGAARQIALGGSDAQVEAAVRVLATSQRSLYLILADEPETTVD